MVHSSNSITNSRARNFSLVALYLYRQSTVPALGNQIYTEIASRRCFFYTVALVRKHIFQIIFKLQSAHFINIR